jgi:cell division septal protein FtsQ
MTLTFFRTTVQTVQAINRKYATPNLKTTRFVRVCLGLLWWYLVLLIGILVFKFFQALR